MIRASLVAAHVADAETLLQPADEQQRQSDADHRQQQRQLRTRLATMRRTGLGASSLTTAELRLLPLMATYLIYPEIGQRRPALADLAQASGSPSAMSAVPGCGSRP